ncbi:TPA: hypothetical protein HA344_06680 [Candidatus Bathyarchaeota archaeon]|nr:hypothetical protein [Candidatus Bathyarchaeota archaeon]
MEISDVKRICGPDKVVGPLQIEFSQRGEWDLGDTTLNNPKTYAEFYNNLKTCYDTHPFYPADEDVTYDLCQMLNTETDIVVYAAFWPHLTSKWVDKLVDIQKVDMFGLVVYGYTAEDTYYACYAAAYSSGSRPYTAA